MIKVQNQAHYDAIVAFAEEAGLKDQLDCKLKYLDEYAEHGDRGKSQCLLYADFAPHSFGFTMQVRGDDAEYRTWFVGGLIFHGSHDNGGDGSFPTLAVSLSPSTGWQVHT